MKGFDYTLLMSSLPPHPRELFSFNKPPVSRIQLNRRLSLLNSEHASDLAHIEALIHWTKIPNLNDEVFIHQATQLLQGVQNDLVKQILVWRLQLRLFIAHARQQHQGLEITYTSFQNDLQRIHQQHPHWQQQGFFLLHLSTALEQVPELLAQQQTLALEKFILNFVWQHYERLSQGHYFDFEAVVIYVLRWDIINRWNEYDAKQASQRFDELVQQATISLEFD